MKKQKPKTLVQAKHIQLGLEKYGGKESIEIQKHLENINWNYTAYLLEDGRVMLVYPDKSFGILYLNKEFLFQDMEKESLNNKSLDSL